MAFHHEVPLTFLNEIFKISLKVLCLKNTKSQKYKIRNQCLCDERLKKKIVPKSFIFLFYSLFVPTFLIMYDLNKHVRKLIFWQQRMLLKFYLSFNLSS